MLAGKNYSTTGTAVGPTPATLHAIVATLSSVHCRPVECPPDYVFVEYDRLRARRHGAQDRRTRYPSRASSRLHAQLTKLFERCLFYYTGQSHRDIFPGKRNHAVTGDKTPTHAGGRSARRVPAGLRLCRVRPPARTTTRSAGSTDALPLSRILAFARSTHKTL